MALDPFTNIGRVEMRSAMAGTVSDFCRERLFAGEALADLVPGR